MKHKWNLVSAIVQLTVGIAAIAAFVIVALSGEDMTKWIVTLLLSIAFVILGVIGIIDDKSQK